MVLGAHAGRASEQQPNGCRDAARRPLHSGQTLTPPPPRPHPESQAVYVANDGSVACLRLLVALKNVFSKCLPNMPKEYIARLVWNRQHRWGAAS